MASATLALLALFAHMAHKFHILREAHGERWEPMETQHSSPYSTVNVDAGVQVTKDSQFIRSRHRVQEDVQVLVEFVPRLVGARHRGSVYANDDGEIVSLER
ncbi:hypothetical protein SprV_0301021300 [Sparganum proliferum]